MAKYKPLKFFDLVNVTENLNERGDSEKVSEQIERKYKEILDFIAVMADAGMSKSGDLTIKAKMERKENGEVDVTFSVDNKLQKIKNRTSFELSEDGNLFLDNPDQQVLPGVLPVGVSEDSEEESKKKTKK